MRQLQIPNVTLNNGRTIPQLGLGVFLMSPADTERMVGDALGLGYRHIDTAKVYENEEAVGRAIARKPVPRDEVFVTTKLANGDQEHALEAFQASLDRLGLRRVDLYLIHWPMPKFGRALGAWRSLIDIADSGRASSIGVSNFEIADLQQLIDETGVVPAVNQIEVHPLHQRRELIEFCAGNGIAVEAWGPLAQGKSDLFDREEIASVAAAHGKSPAQIVLRWHVQQGRILIPKTVHRNRLVENAAVFDFKLSDSEMATIAGLEEGRNFGPNPSEHHRLE